MKIYEEYKKVIKKIGTIKKAYFTSFNLDVDFVESYILPPLLGETQIKNNNNMRLKREDLNTKLKKVEIKFFYDPSMLSFNYKQTLADMYPVKQENGVFHPKVIYLEGVNSKYIIVGSGNLTVSGWGRNIETFKVLKITNDNLHNQVLNFFDDVFKKAGLYIKRKTLRKTHFNHKNNFIFSHKKEDTSFFLEQMKLEQSLTIFSPYFSDLDELFNKNEFKNIDKIKIAPNLTDNIKIGAKEPRECKDKVSFYYFNKSKFHEKNSDSINHSKVWISDSRYAIGSYNCTEAALYGTNFEAAIIMDGKDVDIDSCDYITSRDYNELEFRKDDKGYGEDELGDNPRFTKVFKFVADYKETKFGLHEVIYEKGEMELKELKQTTDIKISLPSFGDRKITPKELNKLDRSETLGVINSLVRDKLFKIYNSESKLIFQGIIEEIGATDDNRFTIGANSLEELFTYTDPKNPTKSKRLENRTISSNINDSFYKKEKHKPKYNYFEMFTYFKNLDVKFEEIKNMPKEKKSKELEVFCEKSICSLSKVMQLLEKQKNGKNIYRYLSIEEFNKLAVKVNKIYKKMDFKITNIDIIDTKDKKFISEVMK